MHFLNQLRPPKLFSVSIQMVLMPRFHLRRCDRVRDQGPCRSRGSADQAVVLNPGVDGRHSARIRHHIRGRASNQCLARSLGYGL